MRAIAASTLRCRPVPAQLLACLRVIVATEEELERVLEGRVDPLQGQLTPENEEQVGWVDISCGSAVIALPPRRLQQTPAQAAGSGG